MFSKRADQKEIIDDLEFSSSLLIDNLKDMEFLNRWLGYNRRMIGGINKVRKKYQAAWEKRKVVIADLGCGSGDALRYIEDWGRKKRYEHELIGIDGNPFVVAQAKGESLTCSEIKYYIRDILSEGILKGDCKNGCDIVMLNNICHHFNDEEIVKLIGHLRGCARLAIIINDLHRHFFAYWGIKVLGKIFNLSSLTKHDGPLSVQKGFSRRELENILTAAKIDGFEIRWTWLFRWQVIIWCGEDGVPES